MTRKLAAIGLGPRTSRGRALAQHGTPRLPKALSSRCPTGSLRPGSPPDLRGRGRR
jgi:hypothetical protein